MKSKLFLRITAVVTLMCFSVSCVTQDCTPDSMDVFMDASVKKERLSDGGLKLALSGPMISYPQAAVEVFHRTADRHFGSRPYSYSYTISRERKKEKVIDVSSIPPPTYTPIYFVGGVGGGVAGGAAVAGAAVQAVALLYNAMSGERPSPPVRKPPTRKPQGVKTRTVEVGKPFLALRGTGRPVAPVTLDRSRTIQIVTPADTTFRNNLAAGSGRAAAEATAAALTGWKTQVVGGASGGSGYILKPSLIRWADRADISLDTGRDTVTVEYGLMDARSRRVLHRFVVHATQPMMNLKTGETPADVLRPAFAKRWAVYVR
jgi:hypothetical protein